MQHTKSCASLSRALAGVFLLILAQPHIALASPKSTSAKTTSHAAGPFFRDHSLDLSGYYFPSRDVLVGKFKLEQIEFGGKDEFSKFEKYGQTIPTWTPFEFSFADLTSKLVQSDTGTYREHQVRVFCTRYRITRDEISFTGYSKEIGEVRFVGKVASGFVARQSNPDTATSQDNDPVLTGDLTIAGHAFRNVSFAYWAGD